MTAFPQLWHVVFGSVLSAAGSGLFLYRWLVRGRAVIGAVDELLPNTFRGSVPASSGGTPVSNSTSTSFVSLALAAIEGNTVTAVQTLATDMFGANVSADGAKLISDVIALGAKPGLAAAIDDIPDVIKFASDLSAAKPGIGLKLVNDIIALAEKPSLTAALADLEDVFGTIAAVAPAPAAAPVTAAGTVAGAATALFLAIGLACAVMGLGACTATQENTTLADVCAAYKVGYPTVANSTDPTKQNLVAYANSVCDPTTGKPLATAPTDTNTVNWGTAILAGLQIAAAFI